MSAGEFSDLLSGVLRHVGRLSSRREILRRLRLHLDRLRPGWRTALAGSLGPGQAVEVAVVGPGPRYDLVFVTICMRGEAPGRVA